MNIEFELMISHVFVWLEVGAVNLDLVQNF